MLRTVQLFICCAVSCLLQGPLEYIFMAASSKLVAASATYPYQVIRARLQVYILITLLQHCVHICREVGEKSNVHYLTFLKH